MLGSRHAMATDVGLQRDNNEDAMLASAKQGLWIVADGMGGHAAGEVASALATKTIANEVAKGKSLREAIQLAHLSIIDAGVKGIGAHGMGSTVVALQSQANQYEICWVGDSRAYLYSPNSNDTSASAQLRQLSTDHSYVQMLFQSGAISEEELHTHPEKNIITQCLGSVEIPQVQVDSIVGEWEKDSVILLCSDGLSDIVSDEHLKQVLAKDQRPQQTCDELIQLALDGGGRDNVTVAVIKPPSALNLLLEKLSFAIS